MYKLSDSIDKEDETYLKYIETYNKDNKLINLYQMKDGTYITSSRYKDYTFKEFDTIEEFDLWLDSQDK